MARDDYIILAVGKDGPVPALPERQIPGNQCPTGTRFSTG